MVTIFFILSAFLISIGKGIADITSDEPNWQKSIFSNWKIDSFFGCKDFTWERKYRQNKILNYLFTTILVFTTDIWHLANFINKIGFYLALLTLPFIQYTITTKLILITIHLSINTILFHLFYHNILRKKI